MLIGSYKMAELQTRLCAAVVISLTCFLIIFGHVQGFFPKFWRSENVDPQYLYTGKGISRGYNPRFEFTGKGLEPQNTILISSTDVGVSENTQTPTEKNPKEKFAIVFDAGSTGSRVHVFHFHASSEGKLELLKDVFKKVEPGLSSYADDPIKGAESLRPLIIKALAYVPKAKQKSTPVCLKATAGLRLLPGRKAYDLLKEVENLFKEYPFPVGDVSIMDGTDEGIFSWMTLNFVLGNIPGGNKTVAALDLGGGSTQLTFVPMKTETMQLAPKSYIKQVSLFNQNFNLYTHSYLGEGLMAARLHILMGNRSQDMISSRSVLYSPCLPVGYNDTYTYSRKKYLIRGPMEAVAYDDCYIIAQKCVKKNIQRVSELSDTDIYIFSYFYDRAKDAGMIGADTGGTATLEDYIKAAELNFKNPNKDSPFLGMDLTFISALLKDGYMIRPDKELKVTKVIRGTDISWALGASFRLLSSSGST